MIKIILTIIGVTGYGYYGNEFLKQYRIDEEKLKEAEKVYIKRMQSREHYGEPQRVFVKAKQDYGYTYYHYTPFRIIVTWPYIYYTRKSL